MSHLERRIMIKMMATKPKKLRGLAKNRRLIIGDDLLPGTRKSIIFAIVRNM